MGVYIYIFFKGTLTVLLKLKEFFLYPQNKWCVIPILKMKVFKHIINSLKFFQILMKEKREGIV